MKSLVTRFIKDKSGATAIEYGLIAGLVAVVIIGGLNVLGPALSTKFTTIGNTISGTTAPAATTPPASTPPATN